MTKKKKTNIVKLIESEIKEIKDHRTSVSNLTLLIGETEIAFENLTIRKKELLNRLMKISEKQNDFIKKIENKYGKGNINIDTGEFTPIKV